MIGNYGTAIAWLIRKRAPCLLVNLNTSGGRLKTGLKKSYIIVSKPLNHLLFYCVTCFVTLLRVKEEMNFGNLCSWQSVSKYQKRFTAEIQQFNAC